MRIGIDATILGKGKGGVERFVEKIVDLLPTEDARNHYVIYVSRSFYNKHHPFENNNATWYPVQSDSRIFLRLLLFPYLMFKHELDALIIQRLAPLWGRASIIAVIHDLVPIKYASDYGGFTNLFVRLFTKFTVAHAALILTPTQTIADEIRDFYPDVKAPLLPYYNGVDPKDFPQRTPLPKRETNSKANKLLFIGAIEPRKNLEVVIRALAFSGAMAEMELVTVGPVRDQNYAVRLDNLADQLNVRDKVKYLGFVSDTRLTELYGESFLLVAPSWEEGFNIPPLEAMASGLPVVCSGIAVHRELFDGAAWFFDPASPESLEEAILAANSSYDEYNKMINKGLLRSSDFVWNKSAARIASAIGENLGNTEPS